jgi:hypothetical protein
MAHAGDIDDLVLLSGATQRNGSHGTEKQTEDAIRSVRFLPQLHACCHTTLRPHEARSRRGRAVLSVGLASASEPLVLESI